MGLFFNKQVAKDSSNSYLDDQKSLFDTKDKIQKQTIDNSYDEYIYQPKDYSNVPKYKAQDGKKIDIVVDQNDFGYDELNPNVKTVNVPKKDIRDDLMELVNNEYIDEKNKITSTSIYDEKIDDEIKKDDNIEIIDIDDENNTVPLNKLENKVTSEKKLSIFGASDEPIEAKIHDVNPEDLKPKPVIEEPKEEVKEEIKINENGNKICPNCGAPLSPSATTCFLCGKKI